MYGATYLPRKFKVAIAVPPSNDVDVTAHDIGLIAFGLIEEDDEDWARELAAHHRRCDT